ncbi:hypothetical protein ABE453_13965 [Brevundimonas diminuta]|uniref:hypothetical protein n=1 Tax=Brevundimonas diminuta TaxID=293 RepID=UPI003209EDF4
MSGHSNHFRKQTFARLAETPPRTARPVIAERDASARGACSQQEAEPENLSREKRERGPAARDNGRGVKGADIADRVLAALRDRLLAPDIVASAMEEARLEMEKRNREVRSRRGTLETDLDEAIRRSERLIDQVADGVLSGAAIKEKLAALEAQRAALEAELAAEEAPSPVALHPGIAEHYRRVVIDLAQALHRSDSEAAAEARDLVRRLIETVVVTPLPERGQYALTVKGKIAALVNQDGDHTVLVDAGAGFERYLTPMISFMT